MKRKIVEPTKEELLEKAIKEYFYIPSPTSFFEIGEMVTWGAHKNCQIIDNYRNIFYYVHTWGKHSGRGRLIDYDRYDWLIWFHIDKLNRNSNISKKNDVFFQFQQRDIGGLLSAYYHFGIDTEPDYQRGRVWDLQDKKSLIHSIFNNIEIGKFALIHTERYASGIPLYEILDGKQRLLTLVDFFEGQFTYQGFTYQELSNSDQNHFYGYSISWAEVRDITQKQKYEYFLKLNVQGVPQDQKHLDYVKELYDHS